MPVHRFDPEQADPRFMLQAQWSAELRNYIIRKLPEKPLAILEVGCGTGAVTDRLFNEFPGRIRFAVGIDIDPRMAVYASKNRRGSFCAGAGEALPFPSGCFDLVFCHYLLLWTAEPVNILCEMRRVTITGGICAAMAEPCYTEMKAEPKELAALAELQREKLTGQGADPGCGRMLPEYFERAGFRNAECGRYRETAADAGYLKTEIEQMTADTGMKIILPGDPEGWRYSIPTYYAIAEKR